MEIGNYRVEIIGGKHISDPSNNNVSPLIKPSDSWFGTWAPWAPWSTSSSSASSWSCPRDESTTTTDKSYVEMKDGDHYRIALRNNGSTKCHAKISIDGNHVGTWILEPWSSATIERPVDVAKKFTFFKVSSSGGQEAGLVKGDPNNGLVTVEFIPTKRVTYFDREFCDDDDDGTCVLQRKGVPRGFGASRNKGRGAQSATFRSDKCSTNFCGMHTQSLSLESNVNSFEAGGTGLQGKSDQTFRLSHEKLELDHDAKVTVNLRLIARKESQIDYDRITPLGARSNPIPPPIF